MISGGIPRDQRRRSQILSRGGAFSPTPSRNERHRERDNGETRTTLRMDQKCRAKWELTSVRLTGLMDVGTRYCHDDASKETGCWPGLTDTRLLSSGAPTNISSPSPPPPPSASLIKVAPSLDDRHADLISRDIRNVVRVPMGNQRGMPLHYFLWKNSAEREPGFHSDRGIFLWPEITVFIFSFISEGKFHGIILALIGWDIST